MSQQSKFKRTLKEWRHFEELRHQEKDRKSLARKITRKIKRQRKVIVNFFYLHFLLPMQTKKNTPNLYRNNAPITQVHTSTQHANTNTEKNQQVLAIVIHAFYFNIFIRIIEKIRSISIPYVLYITTHKGIAQEISSHMKLLGLDAHIKVYENKGRDILPFLKIIELIKANDHQFVLKLHTKKSPQKFNGGSNWCDSMVNQLLEAAIVEKVINHFNTYPDIGIIGPHKHLQPLWRKEGSNMPMIKKLADKIGYQDDITKQFFVGGTMFYARISILNSLIQLHMQDTHFEKEPIPIDGTLVHALERFFGIAVSKEGLEIVDTKFIKSLTEQDTT